MFVVLFIDFVWLVFFGLVGDFGDGDWILEVCEGVFLCDGIVLMFWLLLGSILLDLKLFIVVCLEM